MTLFALTCLVQSAAAAPAAETRLKQLLQALWAPCIVGCGSSVSRAATQQRLQPIWRP